MKPLQMTETMFAVSMHGDKLEHVQEWHGKDTNCVREARGVKRLML
jgi:hypothetical protein